MNILSFFKRRSSAPVARERLQLLLSHERRMVSGQPDLVALLREEILAVIAKHVTIDRDKVLVKMERGKEASTLEVNVDIPAIAAA